MVNHAIFMMKKIAITQSNYIPWKGYFETIDTVDEFVLYDDVQYTRRDWRNRNQIKTPQGLFWLTIPVDVKGKYLQKINETCVSDAGWNVTHWKTIQANYAKAPFFKQHKDFFEELYLDCNETFLSKINFRFLSGICQLIKIQTPITLSSDYLLEGDKTERLLNICTQSGSTAYYSGPAAKSYLDEALFQSRGVEVRWSDFSGYPEYPQLFPPFDHAVSIIDLIFNVGAENTKFFFKNLGA